VALYVALMMYFAMMVTVVFANRTLIFEQKSSANQYRATVALEAAEGGLEWGLAMLNKAENIDASCATSTEPTDTQFRDRYLTTDPTTGALTVNAGAVHAACVGTQTGTGWSCSCPVAGTAPSPTVPTVTTGTLPSFAIAMMNSPTTGTVRLVSYGCTSAITDATCTGDAAATVSIAIGSIAGLKTPPGAPLTARGAVNVGNAALGVTNGDPSSNGITINAGFGIDGDNIRITTVPGTPPKSTLVGNDSSLRNTTEDQMFAMFFGMDKATYKNLPSVTQLTCPCDQDDIEAAYDSGERQLWLNGNLSINANDQFGTQTDPLIMIVDGNVELRGTIQIFGVIYSTGITWDNTGGGGALLRGAAISEGSYQGNGTPDYFYDPVVLGWLKYAVGSFARIPGSWRDF
jgi:Tfp pilus assembly protein PilX